MENDFSAAWDAEYENAGIPSSYRSGPSTVVRWALANLPYLNPGFGFGGASKLSQKADTQAVSESIAHQEESPKAIDLGCGAGRNTFALAKAGFQTTGIDFSKTAISQAESNALSDSTFIVADLTRPLPFRDDSIDLAIDIFVYFHMLDDQQRAEYRNEIRRVLKPEGIVLFSLATIADGYYSQCPAYENEQDEPKTLAKKWDPVAKVANILPASDEFVAELSDSFTISMTWLKNKTGLMHGEQYHRQTFAVIGRPKK